jgi:hypothetical protein
MRPAFFYPEMVDGIRFLMTTIRLLADESIVVIDIRLGAITILLAEFAERKS